MEVSTSFIAGDEHFLYLCFCSLSFFRGAVLKILFHGKEKVKLAPFCYVSFSTYPVNKVISHQVLAKAIISTKYFSIDSLQVNGIFFNTIWAQILPKNKKKTLERKFLLVNYEPYIDHHQYCAVARHAKASVRV
jgi:hypothetical protein